MAKSVPNRNVNISVTDGRRWSRYTTSGPGWLGNLLDEDYFVSAKMPMTLVYPRPDSETQPWARHKKAYPGIEYRIPIVIQGGAYPFIFEPVTMPAGMTLQTDWNDDEYSELVWTPSGAGGPFKVLIRVVDMDRNSVTIEFTVTATTDGFVFVDESAATSGDGTIGSPFNAFTDTRGIAGAIVYLRDGQYDVADSFESGSGYSVNGSAEPMAILGYPGENAVLDFQNSRISIGGGTETGGDYFVGNITTENARSSGSSTDAAAIFWIWPSSGYRFTAFKNHFRNAQRNTAHNDIQAVFHNRAKQWGSNEYDHYLSFVGNRFGGHNTMQLMGPFYGIRFAVCEKNIWDGVDGDLSNNNFYHLLHMKEETTDITLRRNILKMPNYQNRQFNYLSGKRDYTEHPERIEFAYNLFYSPAWAASDNDQANPFKLQQSTGGGMSGQNDSGWVYRNTWFGRIAAGAGDPIDIEVEGNVIVWPTSNPIPARAGRTVTWNNNFELPDQSAADAALDSEFKLTGSARTEWLGRRGHEILNMET